MKNIYGLTYVQLEAYLLELGEKKSKAPFIYQGLYKQQIDSLLDIPAIRQSLLKRLEEDFSMTLPRLVEQTEGDDTTKFLFSLEDGSLIEAVLMRQKYGNSLCISSQVGCNMACAFCQSGRFKKVRNLLPEELTGQIIYIQKQLHLTISNIVLMGIGEPFDNYDNVMQFLEIISHPHGLALGPRHVTVSTCGLVPQIEQYASHPAHGLLAISLHAPDDETRSRLMPVNRRYPVAQLMDAARSCILKTGKKIMPELNDEFVKDVSNFETVAEYKEDIKNMLSAEKTAEIKNRHKAAVAQKVTEQTDVVAPESMVKEEAESFLQDIRFQMSQQGIKLEDYLNLTNGKLEDVENECRMRAETLVKQTLVFEAIAEKEGLEVTDEDLDAEYARMAEMYNQPVDSVKEIFAMRGQVMAIKRNLLLEKVSEFLLENAKIG